MAVFLFVFFVWSDEITNPPPVSTFIEKTEMEMTEMSLLQVQHARCFTLTGRIQEGEEVVLTQHLSQRWFRILRIECQSMLTNVTKKKKNNQNAPECLPLDFL